MPIITFCRGSYSKGKEIAEKVAANLGYECIAREVLLEASEQFNIPETKLVRAIHNAPSIFDRFRYGKEKYIAFIQAALLGHLKKDNVVYHGLAGPFFLQGISHALKVRIIADLEDRVRHEMEREGISWNEALTILTKDDEERRKWSRTLYGIDTRDADLYDLVIHIKTITVDDAVKIICDTARLEHFQATPESRAKLEDLATAAEVKAALVDVRPNAEVRVEAGTVYVNTRAQGLEEFDLTRKIEAIAGKIPGVKEVKVRIRSVRQYD